jgi:uncharacterized protein (TIGR02284 family)
MRHEHDIEILNRLIETMLDSANGYGEAAREVESSDLNNVFVSRSGQRRAAAAKMQESVRALGGEPEKEGSALASAHRMFINLRISITTNNHQAVVDEVERGEDHIRARFEHAMKDIDVSPSTMSLITDVYTSVRSGCDQMREISKSIHAAG